MTLRRLYRVSIGINLTIILLFAVLLVLLTTLQRNLSEVHVNTLESIAAAQDFEVALHEYNRMGNQYLLTRDPAHLATRSQLHNRILKNLNEIEKATSYPLEVLTASRLRARLGEYFQMRDQVEAEPSSYEADISKLDATFERTEQLVADLVNVHRSISRQANLDIARWDRLANLISLALLIMAAGLSLWAAMAAKRMVFAPLARTEEGVRLFAAEPDSRLALTGVLEVKSIAHAFNSMADQLDQYQKRQFEFLAGVAHDLRTPLTALKAHAELMQLRPPTPEAIPAALGIFLQQIERINRMVQDLLDANRINTGQFELQPAWTDLHALLLESLALFQQSAPKHNFQLAHTSGSVMVYCDPHRIVQVINNLLSNAIKFSPLGGLITLELDRTAEHTTVAVADEGIGIKPEELDAIFEPFNRSLAVKEIIPGVGLGLAISRKIIEAHGGTISVSSKPGAGSRFAFQIPNGPPDGVPG